MTEITDESFLGEKKDLPIDKLFRACIKLEGSDIHLKVDKPPYVRVNGTLRPLNRGPVSNPEMVELCFPLMSKRNREIFDNDGGCDLAYMLEHEGVNWAVSSEYPAATWACRHGRPAG